MTKIQPGSIVVGVDGSVDARVAVQWAAEQAALERRPLVVFSAALPTPALVGAWPGPTYVGLIEDILHSAQAVADEAAALANAHRPGLVPQTAATTADPRTALLQLTSEAHLLVLGSRGRGPVGSKMFGSVSAAVSNHAECPVVVCRPGTNLRVKKGVLVGADGTPESLPVVEFAFRQASLRSQPLTITHAYRGGVADAADLRLVPDSDSELSAQHLLVAETIAGLRERYPEVHVDVHVACGSAEEVLATVADRHDLVVIGRHPVDSVARRLSVATANAVLERAHTHVAIVPEAAAG